MSESLLSWIVALGPIVLAFNVVLCLVRAVLGPSAFDRVMALEAITFNVSGAVVLVGLALRWEGFVLDVLLVVALLGFIGTVALTDYLERSLGE